MPWETLQMTVYALEVMLCKKKPPSFLHNVPWTYLGCTLNLSSVLLPSCFLLSTFFLPSSYPLFCIYQKNIFHTIYYKFRTFNFQVLIFNCKLHQYTLSRTYLLATSLLSPCYPIPKKEFFLPFLYSNALFCISIPIKYAIFWLAFMNVVIPPN